MLDLFTIFTKGGIVLWYIQGTALSLTPAVNALIKSVILQERGGASAEFAHENLMLKFKMDNEFELVYVAVYQKIVQLSYIDKLLEQVSLAFRDRYKNEIVNGPFRMVNFTDEFNQMLRALEEESRSASQKPRVMKKFSETRKAERVVSNAKTDNKQPSPAANEEGEEEEEGDGGEGEGNQLLGPEGKENGGGSLNASPRNKAALSKLGTRGRGGGRGKKTNSTTASSKKPKEPAKRVKEARTWNNGKVSKAEAEDLNRSEPADTNGLTNGDAPIDLSYVGKGSILQPLEATPTSPSEETAKSKPSGGGMFSFFKSLTGGKVISGEMLEPALEKMKEHLITKNVAAEISEKLCSSVMAKLEGKVIGTFSGIQSTVRKSMEESLVQILSPKRRVDVLRDVMQAGGSGKPYVITFCGVNGVGKSTNLAKIAFWLLENNHRVLIAACDTFRSGAVEQLRTHARHLGSLHPPSNDGAPANILLYDRGYGKDAAGVAMEAIHFAHQQGYDVVLVDTAGRMQDNEPLMRSLAKLIRVNGPDLVLFVGEALVGNEAVDQLVKFNRALVDHSEEGTTRTIDGILLTKFDTIDDKVGAAISMTYTTGQPIVFVGTGQRYTDLRSLNVQAVVSALLK